MHQGRCDYNYVTRGSVVQWIAHPTRYKSIVSLKTRNFTLVAEYWLIPGTDLSIISQSNLNKLRALW